MFCEKCGKENPQEARFCEDCGNALEVIETAAPQEPVAPVENPSPIENAAPAGGVEGVKNAFLGVVEKVRSTLNVDARIALGGVIALGLAVVIVLLAIFGAFVPTPVKLVSKMNKAALSGNAKPYFRAIASPYTEYYDMDKDEVEEELDDLKEMFREEKVDRKEDGRKISFKGYKLTKKYKKSEVKKISNWLEDYCGYDTDEYKLQAVQIVKFTMIEKEDGDVDRETEEAVLIKVKGKWYLDMRLTSLGKNGIKNSVLND